MALQLSDVQDALEGANFPASPQQLAEQAQQNGAGQDVVNAIRGVTKPMVDDPSEVLEEISTKIKGWLR